MYWNRYAGEVGGVGGALGWEGAIRLQWLQWSLTAFMAEVMPGQKMNASARAIIAVTPWCAECNVVRTFSRRDGGMTIRSLWRATPSTV